MTLLSCEELCDEDDDCKGIYLGSGGECYTLDLLVEGETGLYGNSYTRNRTKPNTPSKAPLIASSEPEIHLQARRGNSSSSSSDSGSSETTTDDNGSVDLVAVHLVDWRKAGAQDRLLFFPSVFFLMFIPSLPWQTIDGVSDENSKQTLFLQRIGARASSIPI